MKINITKEFLIEEYINKKKSVSKIAEELKVSLNTIYRKLLGYNLRTSKTAAATILKCNECGKTFVRFYDKGKNKNVFCSVICKDKFHSKLMKNKPKMPKVKCVICGKELSARHCKYCKSCLYKNCFKGVKRPKQSKFMKENNPCKYHTEETKSRLSLIRGGNGIPYDNTGYGKEFNLSFRKEVRKRDNYICQNCGMTEIENLIKYKQVLSIHHIDYNKKNNNKNNLISLCRHCHAITCFTRKNWEKYYKNKMKELSYAN